MARTRSVPSALPALKGIPKVSTCALETAYHIALWDYFNFTAAFRSSASDTTWVETRVRRRSCDKEVPTYLGPVRRRGHPLEVDLPVVLSGCWVTEFVEVGGIIIKAQRKIVRCPRRSSSSSPGRGIPGSPPSTCRNVPGRLPGTCTSSRCGKIVFSDTAVTRTSPQVDTEECDVSASYQEGATLSSKAICFTDTYTVDDGWGVIVCVLKNWISIRRSSFDEATSVKGEKTGIYTQDMRHPPYHIGEFVRVRGRLCVRPTESTSGLRLPNDFSRAFLRATVVCGGRDIHDETNWFTEVYSQLRSMTSVAKDSVRASPHTPTSVRRSAAGFMNLSARLSL